jgi:hypothetical protein
MGEIVNSTTVRPLRHSFGLATRRHWSIVTGFLMLLAGCGGDSSNSASGSGGAALGTDITALEAAESTLQGAPPTELQFVRYDFSGSLSYSYGFSIADYDGDGKPDISYFDSYTSGRGRLRTVTGAIGHMLWNNGQNDIIVPNETFEFTTSLNPAEFLFERHVAADINGDGRLDIVGVSNSHGSVVAYINPGVHGQPWVRQVLSSHTPGPVNLAVADVNGDGRPDVVVAMRYQPSSNASGAQVGIAWLENTGSASGEWIYHTIDTTPNNYADPRTVQAADINGDGKVEVVTSDSGTGVLAWYSQNSPDNWTRHVIAGINTTNAHFGRLVDMDGDGQLDILQPVTKGVAWVRNVNKASSWEVHPIMQFIDQNWANIVSEVAAGDLHHDGTRDVVFAVGSLAGGVTARHTGGVYIAHQDAGAWKVSQLYFTPDSVVGLQLVDFDGSGYLDVVSNTEYQQNAVTLWKNELGN